MTTETKFPPAPRLPLRVEFAASYLDGVMEAEHPEIAEKWAIIRQYLASTDQLHAYARSVVEDSTAKWIAEVEKLQNLRAFLLGWQGSEPCRLNGMADTVGGWIDGVSGLYELYDAALCNQEGEKG